MKVVLFTLMAGCVSDPVVIEIPDMATEAHEVRLVPQPSLPHCQPWRPDGGEETDLGQWVP